MITKIFLLNIIVIYIVAILDTAYLDDRIEKGWCGGLWSMWAVLTTLSVPAWFVYLIVTW